MGINTDDIERLSRIFGKRKKSGKKDPDTIKKMVGIFKGIFPCDKSGVDIIREQREEMLKN